MVIVYNVCKQFRAWKNSGTISMSIMRLGNLFPNSFMISQLQYLGVVIQIELHSVVP